MEIQLPLLFIWDSHLLAVFVTSVSCGHVFFLISYIYGTGEPMVFAFCIAGSFVVVPNCSFTFTQGFLFAYLCQKQRQKQKTNLNFLSSSCSLYCQSFHAANTGVRLIKGFPPHLISSRISFHVCVLSTLQSFYLFFFFFFPHSHFKINFPFSHLMVWGKEIVNFVSPSESWSDGMAPFLSCMFHYFWNSLPLRDTPSFGFISPWPKKAKKID